MLCFFHFNAIAVSEKIKLRLFAQRRILKRTRAVLFHLFFVTKHKAPRVPFSLLTKTLCATMNKDTFPES